MAVNKKQRWFQPAWRSRRDGQLHLTKSGLVKTGLLTLLGPPLLALLLKLAVRQIELLIALEHAEPFSSIQIALNLLVLSPIVGVILVPAAMVTGTYALRVGYGGWGVALIAFFVICAGIAMVFAAIGGHGLLAALLFSPYVFVYGLTLWGATRWHQPEALLAQDSEETP